MITHILKGKGAQDQEKNEGIRYKMLCAYTDGIKNPHNLRKNRPKVSWVEIDQVM